METEICTLYDAGLSMNQLAIQFNCSYTKIRNILILNDVVVRPSHKSSRSHFNAHDLDIDYFKNIDTQSKAYWLGFIVADGTISKDGYKTSITSKDLEILEKFKAAIKSGHKITTVNTFDKRTNKNYKRYLIQICSKDFVKNIIKHGVTNRKSYTCDFPKIKNKYVLDFIRGLFDGDGSIFLIPNKTQFRISFIGTKEILNYIRNFLLNHNIVLKPKLYKLSEKQNVYKITYSKDSLEICNMLYDQSCPKTRLFRKFNIYNNINKLTEDKKTLLIKKHYLLNNGIDINTLSDIDINIKYEQIIEINRCNGQLKRMTTLNENKNKNKF